MTHVAHRRRAPASVATVPPRRRWPRFAKGLAGALGVVVLASAAFLAAGYGGDRATRRPKEMAPPISAPVSIDGPAAAQGEPAVPGATVTVDKSLAATEGVPGGTFVLPPGLPADVVPPADAPAVAETLGKADLGPPLAFARFVDNCATGAHPCPIGVGATVKAVPYDYSPQIHIQLWPGLTKANYRDLRCDPGYATRTRFPLVITADQPVADFRVKLLLTDSKGPLLDDTIATQSQLDREKAWYDLWTSTDKAGSYWIPGKKPGTDLGNGQQFCVSLRTEGDPANAAKLQGMKLPTPLSYLVQAEVVSSQGTSTKSAVHVAAPTIGPRPPTWVKPLSGHVAQVVTAERAPGSAPMSEAWLVSRLQWGFAQTAADACAAPPGKNVLAKPAQQKYAPGLFATPNYPYDREYTHFAVREAVLEESMVYALCLAFPGPQGPEREAFEVETPDGFAFRIYAGDFHVLSGPAPKAVGWDISAPEAGCHRWRVAGTGVPDGGSAERHGISGYFCDSHGLPWPMVTTFRTEKFIDAAPGKSPYVDMGGKALWTATWCTQGPSKGIPPHGECGPSEWWTKIYWSDQNVLCSESTCDNYRRAALGAKIEIVDGFSNGRRDPLDWRIVGPASSRNPGQGGLPGTGFPEPGP